MTRQHSPRPGAHAAVDSIRRSWALITPGAHRRYVTVVAAQMATSLLDVLGVVLIGLVGLTASAALAGDGSLPVVLPWSDGVPSTTLLTGLAVGAAAALVLRSVVYTLLLRANYRLLVRSQDEAAERLLGRFLQRPMTDIQATTSQQVSYALGPGMYAAVTGLLGSVSVIVSDVVLLALLAVGLAIVAPLTTLVAAAYLGLIAVGVHRSLARWSARTGAALADATVGTIVSVQESVALHRELWTMGRLGAQYRSTLQGLGHLAYANATQSLILQIPRVVYDAALVVGALLISAWQFQAAGLEQAVATLLVFLAAASRVLPSLMRVNGQLVQARGLSAQARQAYDLDDLLRADPPSGWQPVPLSGLGGGEPRASSPPPSSTIEMSGLGYAYPGAAAPALIGIDLSIRAGSLVAIVGPTGGGKSTLADVIVGLLPPSAGSVLIDGLPPARAIAERPGRIGYVPQRVVIIDGSVRANVALSISPDDASDDAVWQALDQAHVAHVVAALDDGLETRLGEHGARLSGGQRQRICLARALYARPSLLLLDEATSALDAETERAISDGLSDMRGRVTVVVIAHRLASVKAADTVVYLDGGRIAEQGTFTELMGRSPGFARQVEILSLPAPADAAD